MLTNMGGVRARVQLLPRKNANGNYVKVVQRVPVRIDLEPRRWTRLQCRRAAQTRALFVEPDVRVR